MKFLLGLVLSLLVSQVYASDIRDISDFSLKQYEGKVIYLDFWASWCKPCQKSFPWMNDLQNKYPSDKFQVVTINVDQKNSDMVEFLKRVPAEFVIYHDPSGQIAEKFQLPAMPTSFIIDAHGKAIKKHVGFFSKNTPSIQAEIEALL
jgi:thiol-disulfide isomerase/thioredoxin